MCKLVNLEPRGFCNSVFYLWLGFLLTGPYPNVLIHKLAFAKLSGISVNNQALFVSQYFSPPEFIAMYTYESSEQGDLTFQQGDVILVTKKDGDWWTGAVGDKSGVFPSNYVRLKDAEVNHVNYSLSPSSHWLSLQGVMRFAGGTSLLGFAKVWNVTANTVWGVIVSTCLVVLQGQPGLPRSKRTPPGARWRLPWMRLVCVSWDKVQDSSMFLDVIELGFRVNVLD